MPKLNTKTNQDTEYIEQYSDTNMGMDITSNTSSLMRSATIDPLISRFRIWSVLVENPIQPSEKIVVIKAQVHIFGHNDVDYSPRISTQVVYLDFSSAGNDANRSYNLEYTANKFNRFIRT